MKFFMIFFLVALSSGCSQLSGIANRAADVNDAAILSAEFTICNAASTGSIQRRYNTQELLKARQTICRKSIEIIEQ